MTGYSKRQQLGATKTKAPKRMKRSRLKARGKRTKKSKGHLFPKGVSEERREFVRSLPCVLGIRGCGLGFHTCLGRVQACHLKSRGAGGPDIGNLWPGCFAAHNEQHQIGTRAFEARWGVDLATVCAEIEREFLKEQGVP